MSTWKAVNPNVSCKRPLNLLQRVFVFTSGDAKAMFKSPVLAGYIQAAAESAFEEITKQAQIDFISNSTVDAEIQRTSKVPDSAFNVITALDPELATRARNGTDLVCVRLFDDPQTGQGAAVLLIYREHPVEITQTPEASPIPVKPVPTPAAPLQSTPKPTPVTESQPQRTPIEEKKKVGWWVWPAVLLGGVLFIVGLCLGLIEVDILIVGGKNIAPMDFGSFLLGMTCFSMPPLILGLGLLGVGIRTRRKRGIKKPSTSTQKSQSAIVFDASGKVLSIQVPQSQWTISQKGQNRYCTQKANNLLQATEILKKIDSIPPLTYYVVDTPDGSLGRDKQGFYTEAPLKTESLRVESRQSKSETVEFASLTGFGDMSANQTTVAMLKESGKYSRLVLLMKCGCCGYESPVETQSGALVRECYCCGVKNKGPRATISVFLGSSMVDI